MAKISFHLDKSDFDLEDFLKRFEIVVDKVDKLITSQEVPPEPVRDSGGVDFAAKVTNRSKSWIYKMVAVLPGRQLNGRWVFTRTDLEAWMRDNTNDPYEAQLLLNENLKRSASKKLTHAL